MSYSDELKDLINSLLTKDPQNRISIKELTEVPIIRDALINLTNEFEGRPHFPEAFSEIKELPCGFYFKDLPESTDKVSFVHLWGDRFYTETDKTLYVYSVGDLVSPSATYPLDNTCYSALITDNHLYIGGTC